jgi:2-keto-4-pentenoate hydratase/2-oxohepta-3-ene-1,7-dioic acid hydratase in catechol pathway
VRRYIRFRADSAALYGIVEGHSVRCLEGDPFGMVQTTDETYALDDVELLPPAAPSKILAVGRNYRSHVGDRPTPSVPELFYKPPSCLVPDGAAIVLPEGTGEVHYEGELVVVIGRRARDVSAHEAAGCIFGLTCGNDVSARDWQKGDLQWWRAKGCDTFGPCGPWIVAGLDPSNLLLRTRLNGQLVQEQSTADLIFSVPEIIAWASRHVTLEPGDLIYTGTPGTTSALKPGDVVEVEIRGIGMLSNRVRAAR